MTADATPRSGAPRAGDRFVHAYLLRVDAQPPYNNDSYEIREVTAVRQGRVYHRPAAITGPADLFFAVNDARNHVRRWLGQAAPEQRPAAALDRHSKYPTSVRLPDPLEERLDAYTEATGISASATIITALTEHLDRVAPQNDS